MPQPNKFRFRHKIPGKPVQTKKRKRDDISIEDLESGIRNLSSEGAVVHHDFSELPLSTPTQAGLKAAHFSSMTDIQKRAIPLALAGRDILGAAKTGSGKTLTFLVPVLENLYRGNFAGPDAGLGAMIISPTRELATQIFDVLKTIGSRGHMCSAGLVTGGMSLAEEQAALVRMNVIVCTPGRILQHLSQTASFNVDALQMLVLDEADRILDLGFQKEVDAILDYLPQDRQTMLFSATQTKRVSDLARLSLKNPEYISVHEAATTATPNGLQQNYIVTPLPEKLDTLWSFLQTVKKSKILVFLSSAKQVRFVYESFRHMQPGIPLLHLHGRQKQSTRLEVTKKFSGTNASCLFATDVVARGLDFPAVDWVVQVDAPEDADTYIHRVGRTARYEREGRAVLFLDPSEEEGMLKRLEAKKVPIEKITVKQKKKTSIKNSLQNMCFKDAQLKYLGQKAFASYTRSIYIQKDKETFKMNELPWDDYAASLGLSGAPRIKFMKGDDPKARKNAPRAQLSDSEDGTSANEEDVKANGKKDAVRTKYDRMFERKNQDILGDHRSKLLVPDEELAEAEVGAGDFNGERIEEDDFLTIKQRIPAEDESSNEDEDEEGYRRMVKVDGIKEPILIDSKRAEKRLDSKKKLLKYREKGTRLVFDDDGTARPIYELENEDEFKQSGDVQAQRANFVEQEREKVAAHDRDDKKVIKERRMEKKIKRKEREREERTKGKGPAAGIEADKDLVKDFLEDTKGFYSDEDGERPAKKEKKWFQKQATEADEEHDMAFEDLENMAAGLIDQ